MGRKKLQDARYYVTKRLGRALHENLMLPDGCTALVGLSGGPASLAMLHALVIQLRRIPISFTLVPVHFPDRVHGDDGAVIEMLEEQCRGLGLHLVVGKDEYESREHFRAVPHQSAFSQLAVSVGAHTVALGHTMQDRAMVVMLSMFGAGVLEGLPVMEEQGVSESCQLVRPLCHLTNEAVMQMVEAEQLPILERRLFPPDQAVRTEVETFLSTRPGSLIEKLRNISNAPGKVIEEYLA